MTSVQSSPHHPSRRSARICRLAPGLALSLALVAPAAAEPPSAEVYAVVRPGDSQLSCEKLKMEGMALQSVVQARQNRQAKGQLGAISPDDDKAPNLNALGLQMRAEGHLMGMTEQAMAAAHLSALLPAYQQATASAVKAQARVAAVSVVNQMLAAQGGSGVQPGGGPVGGPGMVEPPQAQRMAHLLSLYKKKKCPPEES